MTASLAAAAPLQILVNALHGRLHIANNLPAQGSHSHPDFFFEEGDSHGRI
jgi:hypothetical protein